jgi:hypothetical protein
LTLDIGEAGGSTEFGLALEDDFMAILQDLEDQEEKNGFIEDIETSTKKLQVILPRLVRQENTRDNLVYLKQQSVVVNEVCESLDSLCRIVRKY